MAQKRFAKEDWLELGFKALSTNEMSALTIYALCDSAKKTRGSFYFHFKSIDDYLIALAELWLKTYTIDITQTQVTNTNRLDLLNRLATRLDLDLEAGIRSLNACNPSVKDIILQADKMRIEWLSKLYVNSGHYEEEQANALAAIEIAAFTGFKLTDPDMKPVEARNLYENFLKLTNRA